MTAATTWRCPACSGRNFSVPLPGCRCAWCGYQIPKEGEKTMPTRNYHDYQCYVIVGNMRQPAKLAKLETAEIEEKEISYPPRKLLSVSGEVEYTLTLTNESTRQFVAVANGYRNYNCMQRAIRRQKRKLKEMRKRAKKVKYGAA